MAMKCPILLSTPHTKMNTMAPQNPSGSIQFQAIIPEPIETAIVMMMTKAIRPDPSELSMIFLR